MNQRQIDFCNFLVFQGLSAQEAYLKAYPDCQPESAKVQASRLLTNDNVSQEIEALRLEKTELIKAPLKEEHKEALITQERITKLRLELLEHPDTSDTVQRALLADLEKSIEGTGGSGDITVVIGS